MLVESGVLIVPFSAFKKDGKSWEKGPFYKGKGKILNLQKWDDDVKDAIAEADKQLRDKCHEHKIRLRDESQCRQQ